MNADSSHGRGLVFLIVSHREPLQVVRLAARIRNDLPGATVLIHHDQSKSKLERDRLPEGVELVDASVPAAWGTGSLVEITTRCLERIVRDCETFRFTILLSGQDYPLEHLGALPGLLERSGDGYLPIEAPEFAEPLRYELAWFRLPQRFQNERAERFFDRLIYHLNGRQSFVRFANGRLGCCIGIRLPTPFPSGWRVYQGSQWWTLSRRAVEAYLTVKRHRPAVYRRFVRRTIIPDEGIFQTILRNMPALTFADGADRLIRWDDRSSGSPATFRAADFDALRTSGYLLARKFDRGVDERVLDLLDENARARA